MRRSLPRWMHGLTFRLDVLIGLIVLAAIGAFAGFAIHTQEEYVLREASRGATLLTETVRRTVEHHMMTDDRGVAYALMDSVSLDPSIRGLRMLNHKASVIYSRDKEEIGSIADKHRAECSACHNGQEPTPTLVAAQSIYTDTNGRRELLVVTPIYNEQRCSSAGCHAHAPAQRVLGVLSLQLALDSMDRSISDLQKTMLTLSALALVALTLAVSLFNRFTIFRQLRAIIRGSKRVAEGNLEHVIPVHTDDEIGEVARTFNAMTASLKHTREKLDSLMNDLERQVQERTADLQEAQAELIQSAKMSELGKLSASIAHEINNPLMGILTSAKLLIRTLQESTRLEDKEKNLYLKQLALVQRETERCRTIVRSLLDFARQRTMEIKHIEVNAAIEEVIAIASNQITLQGISVKRSLDPEAHVDADFGSIRQALLNVVLNAIEVMPKGGQLTLKTHRDGDRVLIEIGDTGPGIPPEHLAKVCDPFFTTKEKGTGLGLSVVYGIVNRHRGTLEFDTRPNEGTRVRIRLPVTQPRVDAAPQPPPGVAQEVLRKPEEPRVQ